MNEIEKEAHQVAWDFMMREERMLKGLCIKMCRGRRDKLEELWDVVHDRLPHIVMTYDATRSSFKTHAYGNLKWYMWKHMNKGAKYAGSHRQVADYDKSYASEPNIDVSDEVQSILNRLEPYDRAIISLYILCNCTFEEIACTLEVSYGTARSHYQKAIARARHAMRDMSHNATS